MSNRLPLIDILKNEFTEWQIVLTTYDKHWFEVAKIELNSANWLAIEMYAAQNENPDFEYPIIIADSENYRSRARKYYKTRDYPACLNYLRKEIESLIKERLPEENVRQYEGKPHTLSHYWDVLIDRYNTSTSPVAEEIKNSFATIRNTLLNPLSHDNLSQPVYRHELNKAFKLIDDIDSIPLLKNIILLAKGMELQFSHPTQDYTFTFELLSDWRLEINNATRTQVFPKCKVKHWQFNKVDFWNFRTNSPSTQSQRESIQNRDDRLNILQRNLSSIPGLAITSQLFEENTRFENIWTVRQILEDSQNQRRANWFVRLFARLF